MLPSASWCYSSPDQSGQEGKVGILVSADLAGLRADLRVRGLLLVRGHEPPCEYRRRESVREHLLDGSSAGRARPVRVCHSSSRLNPTQWRGAEVVAQENGVRAEPNAGPS